MRDVEFDRSALRRIYDEISDEDQPTSREEAIMRELDRLWAIEAAALNIEPHLDRIICYASTPAASTCRTCTCASYVRRWRE